MATLILHFLDHLILLREDPVQALSVMLQCEQSLFLDGEIFRCEIQLDEQSRALFIEILHLAFEVHAMCILDAGQVISQLLGVLLKVLDLLVLQGKIVLVLMQEFRLLGVVFVEVYLHVVDFFLVTTNDFL